MLPARERDFRCICAAIRELLVEKGSQQTATTANSEKTAPEPSFLLAEGGVRTSSTTGRPGDVRLDAGSFEDLAVPSRRVARDDGIASRRDRHNPTLSTSKKDGPAAVFFVSRDS